MKKDEHKRALNNEYRIPKPKPTTTDPPANDASTTKVGVMDRGRVMFAVFLVIWMDYAVT